jgi:hypothetical protein
MIPVSLEYFIEARASTGDGTFDPFSEKIGHFEDLVFKKCNSFACCDTSSSKGTTVNFYKEFYSFIIRLIFP